MVYRYSMLRLSIVTCLSFLSLLLFSFSCQDHVVPTNPVPAKIKTLDAFRGINLGSGACFFRVQFDDLGDIPITEYGVVFVSGSLDAIPNMNSPIVIFSDPVDLNVKSRVGPGLLFAPLEQSLIFSYRAYAKLNNGTVVFGEVKNVTFPRE